MELDNEDVVPNEEIDYVVPNEKVNNEIPNEEVDYESDYEMTNEIETDSEMRNNDFFAKEELSEDELFNKKPYEELFDDSGDDDDDNFSDDELSDDYEESNKDGLSGDDNDDEVPNEEMPDKIVDNALSDEQIPHNDGEFSPYFKNITEALMFCWIQKHNICKDQFNDFFIFIFIKQILFYYYIQ